MPTWPCIAAPGGKGFLPSCWMNREWWTPQLVMRIHTIYNTWIFIMCLLNSTIVSEFLISVLQLLLLSTQIPCSWHRPGGGLLLLISGPTLGDFPSFYHPKSRFPSKRACLELYFPPRSLSISLWWKMPALHLGPIVVPCAQETRVQGWVPHTAHSPWSPTHLHTIHLQAIYLNVIHLHTIHHTWHTYTFWYTYMWYTYTLYACARYACTWHACTCFACTWHTCMRHTYMWHACTWHACTRHTYMQHVCTWHACTRHTRYISLWLQQPLWINQPSLQWGTSISLWQATGVSTLKTQNSLEIWFLFGNWSFTGCLNMGQLFNSSFLNWNGNNETNASDTASDNTSESPLPGLW